MWKEFESNQSSIKLKDFLDQACYKGLIDFLPIPLPKVVNLNIYLKWDVVSPTKEQIFNALARIQPSINTYRLKVIMINTSSHDYCFIWEGKEWLEINDNRVSKGMTWMEVFEKCVNQNALPVVLQYQSKDDQFNDFEI